MKKYRSPVLVEVDESDLRPSNAMFASLNSAALPENFWSRIFAGKAMRAELFPYPPPDPRMYIVPFVYGQLDEWNAFRGRRLEQCPHSFIVSVSRERTWWSGGGAERELAKMARKFLDLGLRGTSQEFPRTTTTLPPSHRPIESQPEAINKSAPPARDKRGPYRKKAKCAAQSVKQASPPAAVVQTAIAVEKIRRVRRHKRRTNAEIIADADAWADKVWLESLELTLYRRCMHKQAKEDVCNRIALNGKLNGERIG